MTPTPSNTASNTPSITPSPTRCPYQCFSGSGTEEYGWINAISQDVNDPYAMFVVGRFLTFNGYTIEKMARVATNGTLDTSFDPGTSFGSFEYPYEFVQQSDQKYIVVGDFTEYQGNSRNKIVRVNYDGTIDNTFQVGTGFTRTTYYTALDGPKILVCGTGDNQYSGTSVGVLCRLNSDGSLDNTFANNEIPSASNRLASKVIKNNDGTYYVGGLFTHSGRNDLIKLNSDGTYASSDPFNTSGSGFSGGVNDFEVLPDGKLIVVGDFNVYNGVNIPKGIIRLNPDGTRDMSFALGGYSNYQYEVLVQGSKYISVGFSYSYSGQAVNNITRLNNDGTLDTTWNSGDFTSVATEDVIQHLYQITGNTNDEGYIFCGGFFNSYDGVLADNIVKMDPNGFIDDCDPILITPTPTATPTRTIPVTPSMTATPTRTLQLTPTATPTITSTATQTPSCSAPTNLYLASSQSDACNQVNGQLLTLVGFTTSGSCTYCDFDTLNSPEITALSNGTYYVSNGTNVRSWTKASTPSNLFDPSPCTTCPVLTPSVTPTNTATPTITPSSPL